MAFLQQYDAGGDVDSMLEVMAGNEQGSSSLMGIVGEHVLQDVLRRGVKEVEGLVENDQFRTEEEGRDDADLQSVLTQGRANGAGLLDVQRHRQG